VHLDIIEVFIHQQMHKRIVLKTILKFYIKIKTKTAPTCFGAVTPSSGSALFEFAKVTAFNVAILTTVTCRECVHF
jgi:hypothetical protein